MIRETKLEQEIAAALGWTEFDEMQFAELIKRVDVFSDRIRLETYD